MSVSLFSDIHNRHTHHAILYCYSLIQNIVSLRSFPFT